MKKWDVVIIGSGISSLTCAAILSKKGKSVCVLEQYNKPGGYLHCFNRFGSRFDTGAHYVGAMDKGQPFYTLLNYLGVYDSELFVPLRADGFDVFKFPNFTIELPKGYPETIERLAQQFPSERAAITKYFSHLQSVVKHFPTYEFSENVEMGILSEVLETSLAKVVSTYTSNPELKSVLFGYCTLHGVTPEDVSFGMHAIVTDSLIRGAYGFAKGGDALAENFVKVIRERGGEVILKKRVSQIETRNKNATAVITEDGERYEASWVISGIHPKTTVGLVSEPGIFTPAFRTRLENIGESGGIFGIYATLEDAAELDPLRNYYYFSSSDPSKILQSKDPKSKPNTVFLSPSNRSIQNPKAGFTLNMHAGAPMEWVDKWRGSKYAKRDESYEDLKRGFADQVIDMVNDFEPGFKNAIKKFATSSPLTNLHFNGSIDGSAYGIYHSIENTGARALGPRTHVANLLLTGQNCLFPGLLGAAISALRTSGHIVGIKPMLRELRESIQL